MEPLQPDQAIRGRRTGPPHPAAALVAILVLLAVVLTFIRGPGLRVAGDEPLPQSLAARETAEELVRTFAAAIEDGDIDGALQLLADTPSLFLPGLPFRFFSPDDDPATTAAKLGFYAAAVDTEIGACRVEAGALGGADTRVMCDMVLDSPFARVTRVAGRRIPVLYRVDGDRIAGVLTNHLGSPALERYCHWVEQTVPDQRMFDSDCMPIPTAASAEMHRETAGRFGGDSRREVFSAYRVARGGIIVVDILLRAHNDGSDPAGMTFREASAAGFPGLLGGDPTLESFTRWSAVVYEIHRGLCSVDGRNGPATIDLRCPEAVWSGPLIEGLSLDPVDQPATFSVRAVTVAAAAGSTDPGLAAAFEQFCEWAWEARPASARRVLGADCTPVYSAEAARALLMMLGEYTAGPR